MSSDHEPGQQSPRSSASDSWAGLGSKHVTLTRVRIAVAAVALTAFAVFTWYAYDRATHPGADGDAPLIKAEAGPTRVRPDKPGGMEVPHRDKLVYESLEGGKPESRVERLLPPPETPLPRPTPKSAQRAAGTADAPGAAVGPQPPPEPPIKPAESGLAEAGTKAQGASRIELAAGPAAKPGEAASEAASEAAGKAPGESGQPKAAAKPAARAETKPAKKPAPAPKPEPAVKPATKPGAAPAPKAGPDRKVQTAVLPAKPSKPSAAAGGRSGAVPAKAVPGPEAGGQGRYRIQVAAVRSQEGAESAWRTLKKKHADLLAALNLTVEWVDLGAKGVFYRVQGGPLTGPAAKKACAELHRRKAGCLVVRP